MSYITTEHLNIYFEEKGDGAPVLFISGTGGDLRQRPNVLDGPLPKHRRVIAYDQRGLGQTEKPESEKFQNLFFKRSIIHCFLPDVGVSFVL